MTIVGTGTAGDEPRPSVAERLVGDGEVVLALARRDVQSRFGQNAGGYLWTYITPLVWVAATYFAFYFFGRASPVYTDLITFIISGLIPYAAFRYVINAITRVPAGIRGLLIFPSVTTEHGVASAALIEFFNIFIVYAVVALVNYLLFGNFDMDDPLGFIFGVGLAWGLGASYGYLFAVLSERNPTFRVIAVMLLRPSFFLSGIFFTANELPERLLSILSWNPLLHAVEVARDGMLFHYQSRVASPLYVLLWIAIFMAAGIGLRLFRRS